MLAIIIIVIVFSIEETEWVTNLPKGTGIIFQR